ncbi:MAG: PLP-dependent cysteine synthase family protein [Holophagaceae bacterium]|nr:PLP-dependent cysteine synthase family protein [Holophagaceae bacterium]
MHLYDSGTAATPLIRLDGVWAKLECVHPTGSVKDRIARYILSRSVALGLLRPGMEIIEATSGNTGIALAHFGRALGCRVTIVMPENMTEERKDAILALGAELVLCSKEGSFAEAAAVRDRLAAERGAFNPDQFSNPLNVDCHRETTGREILDQLTAQGFGPPDVFVAGVGTGGTLIGVGQALREANPKALIVAVEPDESAVMSGGSVGAHPIYGIGDGFIPALAGNGQGGLHPLIGEVVRIPGAAARAAAQQLGAEHGFCVGISSGANYLAAQRLRERGGTVVTLFPDGYAKYTSEGLRHCAAGRCPYEHESMLDGILAGAAGR